MQRLTRRAFACDARGVLLLGTDSPHMSPSRLKYAGRYLNRYDAVLGPVEDGGYDLLAMRGCFEDVFREIPWGTPSVLHSTLSRISERGLSFCLLSTGFDVDTPADLARALRAGLRLPGIDFSLSTGL